MPDVLYHVLAHPLGDGAVLRHLFEDHGLKLLHRHEIIGNIGDLHILRARGLRLLFGLCLRHYGGGLCLGGLRLFLRRRFPGHLRLFFGLCGGLRLDGRLYARIAAEGRKTFGRGDIDFLPDAEDYIAAANVVTTDGKAGCYVMLIKTERLAFRELSQNKVQDALTYATQAVALGKQDAEAYAESYYVKGDCNYRLGNYAQAASDLNTAINLGQQTPSGKLKNSGYALYSLGYAHFKQQQYNAAITEFRKITELTTATNQVKADAFNRIGDCYLNMRNYDAADANYVRAKATDHTMGDYSMLQQAYIEGLRGNYDKKVDIINQMNAEYPASSQAAKALYEQGRAYVLSGKEDEAAAVFSSIAVRYPGSEYTKKAREELANMAANIAIQDSIAAAQDSIATEAAKAPVVAAQKLYNAGQYQQAEQQLNKAIDEGIGKPYWLARAFVLLSDIYKAQGREVEAKQTLESLKANYKEEDDIQTMIKERMKE